MHGLLKYVFVLLIVVLQGCGSTTTAEDKIQWAQYIQGPDGTSLAADIWLPQKRRAKDRLPTLVYFTRYWRSTEFDPKRIAPNPVIKYLNDSGYAIVLVDVRGTGASYGSRADEFTVQETRDFAGVFDWIVNQSWSNGNLATFGTSYVGNTAEHASFLKHPALKAVVPRFTDFDWFTSLVFPGGFKNKIISSNWGDMVEAMDLNKFGVSKQPGTPEKPAVVGVRPVSSDSDRQQLTQAVEEHKNNVNVATSLQSVEYRDDKQAATSMDDQPDRFMTPYRFLNVAEEASVPAFHWSAWGDSGTAAGVLARFTSFNGPGRYVIGPWSHGASQDANPFKPKDAPVEPTMLEQYEQILSFLKPYMFENEGTQPIERELRYFTMGEDVWKNTESWPPAGSNRQNFYLAKQKTLSKESPVDGHEADHYKVNFEAGTGQTTRWSTQIGGADVYYGDRAEEDKKLLVYDSKPLPEAMEITGAPVVELYLSSSHEDGGVIAYLEAVSPDGKVIMITEGELRFMHRKISSEHPPYTQFGPYHTFKRKDAQPMTVGKVEKVAFSLLPTSIRIPKGYSIRLALAGHDKDTFLRVPEEGSPTWSVQRNKVHTSFLSLPVISISSK